MIKSFLFPLECFSCFIMNTSHCQIRQVLCIKIKFGILRHNIPSEIPTWELRPGYEEELPNKHKDTLLQNSGQAQIESAQKHIQMIATSHDKSN